MFPVSLRGARRWERSIVDVRLGEGTTVIDGWEAVATSYPGFEADLERLCGS